jgi:hypothetical protein
MVIVVSALLLATLIAVVAAIVDVVRRVTRWALDSSAPRTPADGSVRPPAYGSLPSPADPVGPLGGLAPDADLGEPVASSREMHGE